MVLATLNLSAFNAGIVLTRYDLGPPYRLNLNDDHGVLPHVLPLAVHLSNFYAG